jgi:hypothetical protein
VLRPMFWAVFLYSVYKTGQNEMDASVSSLPCKEKKAEC